MSKQKKASSTSPPLEVRLLPLLRDERWGCNTAAVLADLLELLQGLGSTDAPPSSIITPTESVCFARCEEWLCGLGVQSAGVAWTIRYIDASRGAGLVSLQTAKGGDILMDIPAAAMISAGFGRASQTGPGGVPAGALLEELRDNETLALTAALILQEMDPDSFYRPYLTCLPRTYTVPLFWSLETFQKLFECDIASAEKASQTVRAAAGLYLRLLFTWGKSLKCPAPSWTQFRWAMAAATSRQNRVPVPGSAKGALALALIPGWDFMNHDGTLETSTSFVVEVGESAEGMLRFTAPADVLAEQEILMNYGRRSNLELLLYAGFTVAHNIDDCVSLNITLPGDFGRLRGLLFQRLVDLCAVRDENNLDLQGGSYPLIPQPAGVQLVSFRVVKYASGPVPSQAICAAVAASLSKEQLGVLLKDILGGKYELGTDESIDSSAYRFSLSLLARYAREFGASIRGCLVGARSLVKKINPTRKGLDSSEGTDVVLEHCFERLVAGQLDVASFYKSEALKLCNLHIDGVFGDVAL